MKKVIAFYYSDDPMDEEYLDLLEMKDKYDLDFKETGFSNHGGQTIFVVTGTLSNMNKFAREVCDTDDIREL